MEKKTTNWMILAVIMVIIVAIVGVYFYKTQIIDKKTTANDEINGVMEIVSGYMELPDEVPTMATVTDKTKLEPQPFFSKAENGDRLLIFQNASKAILYRPSTKKIIDVSNLLITNSQAENPDVNSADLSPTPTTKAEKIINLALYNGCQEVGLATKIEEDIFGQIEYFKVVSKEDAKRNDYEKTLVIDINGTNTKLVKSLAEDLSAEVASLPDGETKPEADVLIILGKSHP